MTRKRQGYKCTEIRRQRLQNLHPSDVSHIHRSSVLMALAINKMLHNVVSISVERVRLNIRDVQASENARKYRG